MAVSVTHGEWKADVARFVRESGGAALSKVGTGHEGRGWPDLYLAHPLLPRGGCWVELKVGADRTRPEQRDRIAAMRKAGSFVVVVRSGEEAPESVEDELGSVLMRLPRAGLCSAEGLRALREIWR